MHVTNTKPNMDRMRIQSLGFLLVIYICQDFVADWASSDDDRSSSMLIGFPDFRPIYVYMLQECEEKRRPDQFSTAKRNGGRGTACLSLRLRYLIVSIGHLSSLLC